jgi:hypothetical protein
MRAPFISKEAQDKNTYRETQFPDRLNPILP